MTKLRRESNERVACDTGGMVSPAVAYARWHVSNPEVAHTHARTPLSS
jgi:hypothetical protein